MRPTAFLPSLLVVLLVLALYPAVGQQRPAATLQATELPVNLSALAALDCEPEQVVRSLARSLQLQPYQALVLRRALLATPSPASDDPDLPAAETLPLVLSTAQLARLQQVLATPPAVLASWLGLSH